VAVLINKVLIEIPPKFAGRSPVNRESYEKYLHKEWSGAEGLAEDVRYYGKWMRDEAWKRIGHLYPKVQVPKELGGGMATVIAWIWARTIKCPNPACGASMPLVHSFALSTKKGTEVWLEPVVDFAVRRVSFEVRRGKGVPKGTVNRTGAHCIVCGTSVPFEYVREEGLAGRMGAQMMAIVAEGKGGRVYVVPQQEHEVAAAGARTQDTPETDLPEKALGFRVQLYGMKKHKDLFTSRQLVALTTFSNLVSEVRERVLQESDGNQLYSDAVATYLAIAVSKSTDYWSNLCIWRSDPKNLGIGHVFARQAIQMVWDYAEANPFSESSGNWLNNVQWLTLVIERAVSTIGGTAQQIDAAVLTNGFSRSLISTDPPYYDNIGYADLSDFFYVWLRRSLSGIYPDLFGTVLVPKVQELVATPYRFDGSKERARRFFEDGLSRTFTRMRDSGCADYPQTVYYAFKQSEAESDDNNNIGGAVFSASTGWETMLEGLLRSNFSITGTWPMRSEMSNRPVASGTNALASSIVLVCRPRSVDAPLTSRRDFLNALKRELPKALKDLQRGNVAPVDLAQASIGPGMAVFSRYSKVLESDGTAMRVRTALQLINQMLDEVLAEQEGEYDADTRRAVAWFEQFGMDEGPYGVAETLSKAKNTALGTLVEAGILRAQGGKVRLLSRGEFSSDWNPVTAKRLTVWEVTQRLIRALQEQGDTGEAAILDHVGAYGEVARDLAYRLYTMCERKKWADEALAYNSLVVEWFDINDAVEQLRRTTAEQAPLFS